MAKTKKTNGNSSPKRQRGRPSWKPTDDERQMVMACMASGFTQEQVAAILKIDHETLVKHCRHELDVGHLEIDAKIGGKLVQKCLAGDLGSIIWYEKTRRGMKETSGLEHSGSIATRHEDALDALR